MKDSELMLLEEGIRQILHRVLYKIVLLTKYGATQNQFDEIIKKHDEKGKEINTKIEEIEKTRPLAYEEKIEFCKEILYSLEDTETAIDELLDRYSPAPKTKYMAPK